ncbi:MAG: hypothetical protein ACUVXI_13000 [bacterium]
MSIDLEAELNEFFEDADSLERELRSIEEKRIKEIDEKIAKKRKLVEDLKEKDQDLSAKKEKVNEKFQMAIKLHSYGKISDERLGSDRVKVKNLCDMIDRERAKIKDEIVEIQKIIKDLEDEKSGLTIASAKSCSHSKRKIAMSPASSICSSPTSKSNLENIDSFSYRGKSVDYVLGLFPNVIETPRALLLLLDPMKNEWAIWFLRGETIVSYLRIVYSAMEPWLQEIVDPVRESLVIDDDIPFSLEEAQTIRNCAIELWRRGDKCYFQNIVDEARNIFGYRDVEYLECLINYCIENKFISKDEDTRYYMPTYKSEEVRDAFIKEAIEYPSLSALSNIVNELGLFIASDGDGNVSVKMSLDDIIGKIIANGYVANVCGEECREIASMVGKINRMAAFGMYCDICKGVVGAEPFSSVEVPSRSNLLRNRTIGLVCAHEWEEHFIKCLRRLGARCLVIRSEESLKRICQGLSGIVIVMDGLPSVKPHHVAREAISRELPFVCVRQTEGSPSIYDRVKDDLISSMRS